MAAIVRVIEPGTVIGADTRILGVEIGSERAEPRHVAKAPPIVTTVRLPPVRDR